MPKQTPSASDYTSVVKSAAVANDLSSKPVGSAAAAKSAKSLALASGGGVFRGSIASIISQSAVAKSIIPRPITTSAVPFPIPEKGLVLWVDATNLSSLVFGDTRAYDANSYSTVTSIKDSYKGLIGSAKASGYNDPVYIPSVNSNFLSLSQVNLSSKANSTNMPALYFRGMYRSSVDSHTWQINQSGKPITMFVKVLTISGGVTMSSSNIDSFMLGYSTSYDHFYYNSDQKYIGAAQYTLFKSPVTCTVFNRLEGSTRQVAMRINGDEKLSINMASQTVWSHNPNNIRNGRNNGEIAEILLCEMIIYNEIMTLDQIVAVETYLNKKWTP